MPAESAILQAGIEAAIESSVFDSPSASCSNTGEDIFIGLGSSEAMGGATLRDIYAKAWEVGGYTKVYSSLRSSYLLASQRTSYLDTSRAGCWRWCFDLDLDTSFTRCPGKTNQRSESFKCIRGTLVDYWAISLR